MCVMGYVCDGGGGDGGGSDDDDGDVCAHACVLLMVTEPRGQTKTMIRKFLS